MIELCPISGPSNCEIDFLSSQFPFAQVSPKSNSISRQQYTTFTIKEDFQLTFMKPRLFHGLDLMTPPGPTKSSPPPASLRRRTSAVWAACHASTVPIGSQ